jgi:lipopolysaccharide export system protein LptA
MTGFRLLACLAVVFALAPLPAAAQSAGDLFSGFGGKSKDPIEVDAASLEIYEEGESRISVFSGGVTVKRGNTTMKAAVIKLVSDKKGDKANSFNTMEATGTVYVNSGEQTATGQRAFVDMKTQTITLTGDVVLSQGKNVIVGDKLVIDMKTGRAKVEQQNGKIRGVFSPETGKVDGDGAKPDAAGGKKPPAKKAAPAKPAPAADTPTQ